MTREEHIYQLKQYLRGHSICMCPSSSLYWKEHWEEVIKALEQEPKAGHWIRHYAPFGEEQDSRECSNCHAWFKWDMPRNSFCPNCGAKMAEPQESEDKE